MSKEPSEPRKKRARELSKEERKRLARLRKRQARKRAALRRKVIKFAVWTVIVMVLAGGSYWFYNRATAERAGQAVPLQGRVHISPGGTHAPYNSLPPTSGAHYGDQEALWGVQAQPIPDEVQVHNLEHGGIMVQYRPGIDEELLGSLEGLVLNLREKSKYCKLILAPYPGLDRRIALTAWGWIDKFDKFDPDRITAFIDDHIDRGPEKTACP